MHGLWRSNRIYLPPAVSILSAQLWLDGYEGRGLPVKKIFDGYKSVTDWPAADFYKVIYFQIISRFLAKSWSSRRELSNHLNQTHVLSLKFFSGA